MQSEEGACIKIKDLALDRNMAKMDNARVGKLFGRQPNIEMLHKWVMAQWATKGNVSAFALAKGIFCFLLLQPEDYRNILIQGPLFFGKKSLALCKWHPRFNPLVGFFALFLLRSNYQASSTLR